MSQKALALRFLTRTQADVAQMRACLPEEPVAIETVAIAYVERMAHKISSGAEAFGFPEIDAIAGAIELMTQACARSVRQRLEMVGQLAERISALSVYVEYELAENEIRRVPEELPLSADLPGSGTRRK
jgi:HPt (histidine-containing phosphotransfer) domain-containing protein